MKYPGKIVFELGPTPTSPRNSEGAFIQTKSGELLFIYSHFAGGVGDDNDPASLCAVASKDGGKSWSEPRVVLRQDQFDRPGKPCENIMSVSLLRMEDGAIGLFFFLRYGFEDAKLHLMRSYDEGMTFEGLTCCMPGLGYYVTNNDRVIRTSTGRLIAPGNFHRVKAKIEGKDFGKYFDARAVACFSISDDDGKSWREAADCCFMPVGGSQSGLQETGLIELKDGRLWAYFRTDTGFQYESFSTDNGEHWSTPQPSVFTSPLSPLSMKRAPGGELLAVWNPNPVRPGENPYGGRNPLVLAISRDEGKSWTEPVVLEDTPGAGYCYTAIHFEENYLLLGYCAGREEDGGCLKRLRMRRIELEELGL